MGDSELAQRLAEIIRSGSEEWTYELKWDVDIGRQNKEGQAEFIRDIMCLANADPGNAADRYLIMNATRAEVNPDAKSLEVDDATYQQIVRSWLQPEIRFTKVNEGSELGNVAVIVIQNTYGFPYEVTKSMKENENILLEQRECLTRSGSSKRRVERDDLVAMGEAIAESRIGGADLPSANTLAQATPYDVRSLAERVLEAEKTNTLMRAIRQVARETAQAWRSTGNNKGEDYLQAMADKLVVGCDWLCMVGAKAVEFGEESLLRETVEGLKKIYALSGQRNLGHPGITERLELSIHGPLIAVFPRLYALGGYAVACDNIDAVGAICEVDVVPEDGASKAARRLVNNPLLPGRWHPLEEFSRAVSLFADNPLYQMLLSNLGNPVACLCQFDLLASLVTPQSEWQSCSWLAHRPSFLTPEFDLVRPLVNKMVGDPAVFARIGVGKPVLTLLAHTNMLEEKIGNSKLIPRGIHPTAAFFDDFREELKPYLRAEHERHDSR